MDDGHLSRTDETKILKENQAKAKEAELSDTLSPSKEKSSDDTTDAQMDDHELNEPIAKVALLKDELQGAQSETESKQEIQQLRHELIEAQELARTSKQKCFELQALLEEERKAYRLQAEESTKQIQVLQAQLHRLQKDIERLHEEKENEISSTRNELLSAQNEILLLQDVAEKATSERDADVTILQEELQKVRAELERWHKEASKYEKEIVSLQASFQLRCQQYENKQREEATHLQGELEKLRKEWAVLESECLSLKKENSLLACELQQQEKELHNSQQQSLALTSDLSYEKTQAMLSELRLKFEITEQEKQSVTDELKQCKENLKLLQEKGNNHKMILISLPFPLAFHISTRPSRIHRPYPGFPVLVLQPIVVEKEPMALDACDGSFGSCDSHGAVPRPHQSFSMRTVVESLPHPPSRSWHHSHIEGIRESSSS
ncbi:hypothetical protein Chor_011264 [Crotalus horridus]